MWICLVTLIPPLLFLKDAEATLLKPARQCVPTATVQGPCHVCVCSSEGVFHCQGQPCRSRTLENSRPAEDCERNYVYREDDTFCTCGNKGYWLSDNCEEKFKYLQPRFTITRTYIRTNIVCLPNNLYLIDCNICRCAPTGFVDVQQCTNRYCFQGHKADSCSHGDILRLDQQICTCSDINYYIDRLCVGISKRVFQPLKTHEVLQLIDIGRSWRRLQDLQSDVCNTALAYTLDCNQCSCTNGHLVCSKNICDASKKPALRNERSSDKFDVLPELRVETDRCEPGKKYRYKCNTCVCSADSIASCTTMICLEDFVLDVKALRGVLSNS